MINHHIPDLYWPLWTSGSSGRVNGDTTEFLDGKFKAIKQRQPHVQHRNEAFSFQMEIEPGAGKRFSYKQI